VQCTREQAWLTAVEWDSASRLAPPSDSLVLQDGAYFDLAPDPQARDGGGTEPRHGTYLVGPHGCSGEAGCEATLVGTIDPPTPRQPTGLTLTTETPIATTWDGVKWHAYHVQVCNEASTYADYFGADARLLLRDGTLVRAAARRVEALGDRNLESRLDTIALTLVPDACASGWLVFGTDSDAEPARIQWHGRILELAGSADETTQSAVLVAVVSWLTGPGNISAADPIYEPAGADDAARPRRGTAGSSVRGSARLDDASGTVDL
jgi:hypothetical protein